MQTELAKHKHSVHTMHTIQHYMRVPSSFFGIRDLAYFKAGIRDFEGKGGRDSGL